jgi:hypothetical protein
MIKSRLFAPSLKKCYAVLTLAAIASIGTAAAIVQPSWAGSATFFCGIRKGVPSTYAKTPRGNAKIISWVGTNFPPPWTPMQRCLEVSKRFERNYANGLLKTIKTGNLNGNPVVCAARSQADPCTDRTLLFTLKPGSNPNYTVRRLLDRNGLAAGNVLLESTCMEDCPMYVNVDTFIDNASVEEDVSSEGTQEPLNLETNSTP